jgi:hypothetical protein
MNAIEHLETLAWKTPKCYGGYSPVGDYVVLTQNRDSELLERVNWEVARESLNAEPFDSDECGIFGAPTNFASRPNVYHWRAGHWAVGWVEYLCVRQDAPDAVKTEAGEIVCALADYPILAEDKFSEREHDAVCTYWEGLDVSDRVRELQDAGLCIFAARRDCLPEDPNGMLYESLRVGL